MTAKVHNIYHLTRLQMQVCLGNCAGVLVSSPVSVQDDGEDR